MASSTFPTVPSDMTAEWLSRTLGAEVVEFEVEPMGAGVGFAGSVYRVRLTLGSGDTQTAIWKVASTHPPTHRLLMEHGAYEREAGFYAALAPRVSSASKPYFSEYNAESGALCILMEDLGELDAGDQGRWMLTGAGSRGGGWNGRAARGVLVGRVAGRSTPRPRRGSCGADALGVVAPDAVGRA